MLDPSIDKKMYDIVHKAFLQLVKHIGRKELKLTKIYAETFKFRHSHIQNMESSGFKKINCLKELRSNDRFKEDSVYHYIEF